MSKRYTKRTFTIALDGTDQQLTLRGIYTPSIEVKSDNSNLQPVYTGVIFLEPSLPLGPSNYLDVLQPGEVTIYKDLQEDDRFERTRSFFIERNYTHILSEWYVRGTAGDIVQITWLDEGIDWKDTGGNPIDVTTAGLSR